MQNEQIINYCAYAQALIITVIYTFNVKSYF